MCELHNMDETQKFQLIVNLVTGILLLVSELLGLSNCEANGIIHYLYRSIACLKPKLEDVKEPEPQNIVVSQNVS